MKLYQGRSKAFHLGDDISPLSQNKQGKAYTLRAFLQRIQPLLCCIFMLFPAMSCVAANYSPRQDSSLSIEDIERFTTVMQEIKEYYVYPVDDKALLENAIHGMLNGLDPHSTYLDIAAFSKLSTQTVGQFAGLGIELIPDDGYIRIISPIDDTPAQKAGLQPGDLILKIDDAAVQKMSLEEALQNMRGPVNSKVKLTLYRPSTRKVFTVTLRREIIKIISVKQSLIAPGYGYVRISEFQAPTANLFKTALQTLTQENKNQPLKGLILDLRNNPGGLLDSAIAISDSMLDKRRLSKNDLIVYTKGRNPKANYKAHASAGDLLAGAPIVILINEGSASGAEIVAGALQDHQRAIILGTHSFGKGSVQAVFPLDKKHAIKLTTALYYTPNGRSIQNTGIIPDIEVKPMQFRPLSKKDTALLAALNIQESDLKNHIVLTQDEKTSSKKTNKKEISTKNNKNLTSLSTDFQLYQALAIVKALAFYRQNA